MTQSTPATNHPTESISRLLVAALVFFLYLVACASPAVQTRAVEHDGRRGEWGGGMKSAEAPGWLALMLGWMPEAARIPWSANLFLFVGFAFLLFKYHWVALVLGVIASLAALPVFSLVANPHAGIESLHWGCYVWLASLFSFTLGTLSLCIASLFRRRIRTVVGIPDSKAA